MRCIDMCENSKLSSYYSQWWIPEGVGLHPPPPVRISQAHILTYAYQGYLTSRYGFQSNAFDLCDGSERKYKFISSKR